MSRRGYEEIDIRERRRSDREPDFLREDYGRTSAGPLIVRDDRSESIEIRSRERLHDRRERDVIDREDVIITRGSQGRERPKQRDFGSEEISYRRDKPFRREVEREEILYRPREREIPAPAPQIAREREEYVFRPRPREQNYEREEITIREREREQERPKEREYKEEEIVIRRDERSRERPRHRDYREEEEIVIRRDERSRERPRQRDYREEEEITIRRDERDRDRPKERDRGYERDEIIFRRDEYDRGRLHPDYDREEISIRSEERDRISAKSKDYKDEELVIRREERERPQARSRDYREEDIVIRRGEGERPRAKSRDFREEEIRIRKDERARPRAKSRDYREDLIIRRDEREREQPRDRSWERSSRGEEDIIIRHNENDKRRKDEVIIRRNEKSPSPTPEPETIRGPTIHQEIVTHHRHIDHGFERAPAPTPPKPRSPSPKSNFEEIEIRRRGSRNGRQYDEDILIERETGGRRRAQDDRLPRRRSFSPASRTNAISSRDELDIAEEADYYNARASERSYIGEGYNGATRDWAIVDVPPGTKRVHMEGVGGANQEITWQRYNGVRRSKFIAEEAAYGGELERYVPEDAKDRGRRFVGQKKKEDTMWTEITKDLVIKEAIEESGYDYEETEFFFYVMVYLRYEDVLQLVELSDRIRHDRRDRIREIEFERSLPRDRPRKPLPLPWDEEKIYEREVIYESAPPPKRHLR